MSKFVMELQKLCLDSKVTCSELLMKAYFLAQKLERCFYKRRSFTIRTLGKIE